MNQHDEFIFWSKLLFEMEQVPNDLRSMNYTAYLSEVEMRIYELEQELALSTKD